LIAKVTGPWELDAVQELIDTLAEDCKARGCKKLLVDCLDVGIEGQILDFERFLIGRSVGSKLRHIKVAGLFPHHQINKFGEAIAISEGAEALVTSERDEAIRWLTDGPADQAAAERI